MSQIETSVKHYPSYINGQWIDADSGGVVEVQNPANDDVFATVPDCRVAEAEAALESSQAAQSAWQALPAIQRANHIMSVVDELKKERDHFSKLLVQEQGKTLAQAYGEFDDTIRYMTYSAEAARRLEGNIFPSDSPNEQLSIHKVPYGVTVGLCAFNYPLALIGRKVGPALVTGNTMVLKPHEATPITASEFCRVVDRSTMPPGVINMITGSGLDAASTLVASPITKLVSVTGSIRAGQAIYKGAAENITALSLELGGKAPFIVLEDADIDKAVDAVIVSRYANCGQVCICSEVAVVHESIADEFTEKVLKKVSEITVGDPMTDVFMGPSVTKVGLQRIDDIVKKTISQGAELAAGGKRPDGAEFERGNWYEPTVLVNVDKNAEAAQEEIFGPVLPIVKISDYEEAVEWNNARHDGLSAYLWTNNYRRHNHAIDNLQVGTIFINKQICGYIQGYHSGCKRSGIGGEDGVYGIEGYLQKKAIYLSYED